MTRLRLPECSHLQVGQLIMMDRGMYDPVIVPVTPSWENKNGSGGLCQSQINRGMDVDDKAGDESTYV